MSDPRINPDYRGENCPTCGERLPLLFGEQCNHCNALELKRAKAKIAELEAILSKVIKRAEDYQEPDKHDPVGSLDWVHWNGAQMIANIVRKELREVSDE